MEDGWVGDCGQKVSMVEATPYQIFIITFVVLSATPIDQSQPDFRQHGPDDPSYIPETRFDPGTSGTYMSDGTCLTAYD